MILQFTNTETFISRVSTFYIIPKGRLSMDSSKHKPNAWKKQNVHTLRLRLRLRANGYKEGYKVLIRASEEGLPVTGYNTGTQFLLNLERALSTREPGEACYKNHERGAEVPGRYPAHPGS